MQKLPDSEKVTRNIMRKLAVTIHSAQEESTVLREREYEISCPWKTAGGKCTGKAAGQNGHTRPTSLNNAILFVFGNLCGTETVSSTPWKFLREITALVSENYNYTIYVLHITYTFYSAIIMILNHNLERLVPTTPSLIILT